MAEGTASPESKPTKAGYLIGAVFLLFIIAGVYIALGSGGDDGGSAHISSASGSSNELSPDDREGTPYEPPQSIDLATAAAAAKCVVHEDLPEEGHDHLSPEDTRPSYGTVPPTSGDHIGPPLQQADGAWADPAAQVAVVHSLEHGRIAIQYSPNLAEADQLALKGLYDSAYSASLLFPNPDMPYATAATSWRNLIACPEWQGQKTLDAINAFGVAHWGHGREPMEGFPALSGPSFGEPAS